MQAPDLAASFLTYTIILVVWDVKNYEPLLRIEKLSRSSVQPISASFPTTRGVILCDALGLLAAARVSHLFLSFLEFTLPGHLPEPAAVGRVEVIHASDLHICFSRRFDHGSLACFAMPEVVRREVWSAQDERRESPVCASPPLPKHHAHPTQTPIPLHPSSTRDRHRRQGPPASCAGLATESRRR